MNILYKQLPSGAKNLPCVATVGIFDGVHRGHAWIIQQVTAMARRKRVYPLVITFFPAPECILERTQRFHLTDWKEKVSLIRQAGCPYAIVFRFDTALAGYTGEAFIEAVLRQVNIRYLLVGDDFKFGKNRFHGIPFLRTLFKARGGAVQMLRKRKIHGETISSSQVRAYIQAGDVVSAGRLLGRNFSLNGIVVSAKRLGRLIGVPTANISVPPSMLLPRTGIYAVRVLLKGKSYDAVANIGFNPTIASDDKQLCFEVHIFDFSRDIAGQELTVFFEERIRDERKFDSLAALSAAIQQDIVESKKILSRG